MKKLSLILCLVFSLGLAFSGLAQAACGDGGCTPGYWKQEQHFDSWPATLSPDDSFSAVFGVQRVPDVTLLEALNTGGGGEAALGRHAVAALLNALSYPTVEYFYTSAQVITMVQTAYTTGEFQAIKNQLNFWNEVGCPLD